MTILTKRCLATVAVLLLAAACSGSSDSTDPVSDTTATPLDSIDPVSETTTTTAVEPADSAETDREGDPTEDASDTPVPDEGEAGSQVVELAYYETQMVTGSPSVTNCEPVEAGVSVCDFEGTGAMIGTHVGHATETQNGTLRFTSEPCTTRDGTEASLTWLDVDGAIFSQSGDQLHFRARASLCGSEVLPSYWTVTGGTGRFENASGTMSSRQDDAGAISVGTLRVRADLWEDILAPWPD